MFRKNYPIAWEYHANTNLVISKELRPHEWRGRPFKEYASTRLIPLPKPSQPMQSLASAIEKRRSCRSYTNHALSLRKISTILHYSYGILQTYVTDTAELLLRPVPSGGGLYPLELYCLNQNVKGLAKGLYHYSAISDGLEALPITIDRPLEEACFVDSSITHNAACIVFITAVVGRTCWKYGDRGYRMLLIEAGHIAQNLNLVSTSLELGSVNINGFYDSAVSRLLAIDAEEEIPLYCVAIGKPARSNPRNR